LARDNRFACRFQNGLASSRPHDENRWERKPKQPRQAVRQTESMGQKARSILAHSYGLESKRISGGGGSVFLDFPFYRTYQELEMHQMSEQIRRAVAAYLEKNSGRPKKPAK